MKKVIIRLIVVALIVALAVLVTIMAFQPSNVKKVYNTLNNAVATNGEITKMTTELETEFNNSASGSCYKLFQVFKQELTSLSNNYVKLFYVNKGDDNLAQSANDKTTKLIESLSEVNSIMEDTAGNESIDKAVYIENAKLKIIQALQSLIDVNIAIESILLDGYYNQTYNESLFLSVIKSNIAKEFFICSESEDKQSLADDVYNFYQYLSSNGLKTISSSNETVVIVQTNLRQIEMAKAMEKAKELSINKIITDYAKYAEQYKDNADKLAKIKSLAKTISDIDGNAGFKIRDFVEGV